MSKLQQLENETADLQDQVKKDMMKYSERLKLKLSQIADFRQEFDSAFDGFVNNDLPKDEAFYKIQAEMLKK